MCVILIMKVGEYMDIRTIAKQVIVENQYFRQNSPGELERV